MKTTLVSGLEKAGSVAAVAGMLLPPWNLVWWTPAIAFGLYSWANKGDDDDASGAMGIALLVLPGLVASAPFYLLAEKLRRSVR